MLGTEVEVSPFCEAHLETAGRALRRSTRRSLGTKFGPFQCRRRLGDLARTPGFVGVAALLGGELSGSPSGASKRTGRRSLLLTGDVRFDTMPAARYSGRRSNFLQDRLGERGCSQIYLSLRATALLSHSIRTRVLSFTTHHSYGQELELGAYGQVSPTSGSVSRRA